MSHTVRAHEVAKQYRLTLSYVYRLAYLNQWKRIKIGREVHYDVLEVAETLQK